MFLSVFIDYFARLSKRYPSRGLFGIYIQTPYQNGAYPPPSLQPHYSTPGFLRDRRGVFIGYMPHVPPHWYSHPWILTGKSRKNPGGIAQDSYGTVP